MAIQHLGKDCGDVFFFIFSGPVWVGMVTAMIPESIHDIAHNTLVIAVEHEPIPRVGDWGTGQLPWMSIRCPWNPERLKRSGKEVGGYGNGGTSRAGHCKQDCTLFGSIVGGNLIPDAWTHVRRVRVRYPHRGHRPRNVLGIVEPAMHGRREVPGPYESDVQTDIAQPPRR